MYLGHVATCTGMIEYDRPPHIEYYHLLNTKPVHGRYSVSGGILSPYTKFVVRVRLRPVPTAIGLTVQKGA